MLKIDYKEIINPLLLFPLIVLAAYLIGIRGLNLLIYSLVVFFFFSFINNIILVLRKTVKRRFYLYVYTELFFSLIFLIPLFYLIKLKQPILMSFFIIGLMDFIIQVYYNILPRKSGKEIVKLWKNNLVKSERRWIHPISMQKYIFKHFICEIFEVSKINPTVNCVNHRKLMKHKIKKNAIMHQYGDKNSIAFQLYLKEGLKSNYLHGKKIAIDKNIMANLKKIDKKASKGLITAYLAPNDNDLLRVVFKKEFVLNNPHRIYNFLAKVNSAFPSKH